MSTTIAIVDDHVLLAEALRRALADSYAVIWLAHCGRDAVLSMTRRPPAILLLDMALPDLDARYLLPALVARHPGTRVLALTEARPNAASAAVERGASAVVSKAGTISALCRAVDQAAHSLAPHPHQCLEGLTTASARSELGSLTPREQAVAQLLGRGLSNAEIGRAIGITSRTVHFHRTNLRRKLGLKTTFALHRFAALACLTDASAGLG